MLEIASGTGQHVVHLAEALPGLTWQPSDPDPEMWASIEARIAETGLPNVRHPLAIDVRDEVWPIDKADAVICINMVHISPWEATLGLMKGAAGMLGGQGVLFLYGPYRRMGDTRPRAMKPSMLNCDGLIASGVFVTSRPLPMLPQPRARTRRSCGHACQQSLGGFRQDVSRWPRPDLHFGDMVALIPRWV